MPTSYLLPCDCGKKTTIDSSQAGLNVRCECGAELAVPTMRGLSTLEQVEAAPRVERSGPSVTWGPRQGLMFLGGTILAIAALAALGFWWVFPGAPLTLNENYQEQTREAMRQLPPEHVVEKWHEYRTGIVQPQADAAWEYYEAVERNYVQRQIALAIVAAIGLLLVMIGLLTRPKTAGDKT